MILEGTVGTLGSATPRVVHLEVIIGSCNFFAFMQRAALATFHDVHSFIRKIYYTRSKMWRSVRREHENVHSSCLFFLQIGAHRFLARSPPLLV